MIENNMTSLVNERHYRTVSDMDIPHTMNLTFIYDLPFDPKRLPTQYMISREPPVFGELRTPSHTTLAVSLVKRFTLRERLNFDARVDASNLTNTPWWDAPGTSLANKGTFGVIQTADGRRIVQFSFRMVF